VSEEVKDITKRSVDFSQWYIDVVRKADLADYTPVRGCMVIKPYGYAIWEAIQRELDRRIKETGHVNAYFPLFVPESLLMKEAEHVEGFAPEVPWVTQVGEEKLEERLAIRPTSEAIIGHLYADWIQSYRDLPLLINQWANVVRWEKRTRPFLRTSEFLWQEGHTCHATHEEALEEVLRMLDVYRSFAEEFLGVPVVAGLKSDSEKFAGAVDTYAIEALMGDGKALQMGTSHDLGQNFAKAFGIKFLDQDNTEKFVWQTSWGVSTRLIGGLVMVHGDDRGLVLPPTVAPIQAVVVPIYRDATKEKVLAEAAALAGELSAGGLRVKLDDREGVSPGWKFNDWEMRGVPLRVELGPKDIEAGQVTFVRRDTGEKSPVPRGEAVSRAGALMGQMQAALLERARSWRDSMTRRPADMSKFKAACEGQGGFLVAGWCGSPACEAAVKEETTATIRCIPLEGGKAGKDKGVCVVCGAPAKHSAWFARAY